MPGGERFLLWHRPYGEPLPESDTVQVLDHPEGLNALSVEIRDCRDVGMDSVWRELRPPGGTSSEPFHRQIHAGRSLRATALPSSTEYLISFVV
jgi:hypothetical protein